MGITRSKQLLLTTYELQEFADSANISLEDVQMLYKLFQNFSSLIKDDGVIDLQEFHKGLQNKSQQVTNLIFNKIDLNNDNVLNFREFILGYATFLSQNKSAQIKYLFRLLDKSNKNQISENDIITTLHCLLSNFSQILLKEDEINQLIRDEMDQIFKIQPKSLLQFKSDLNICDDDNFIQQQQEQQQQQIEQLDQSKERTLDYQTFYLYMLENTHMLEWLNIPKHLLK